MRGVNQAPSGGSGEYAISRPPTQKTILALRNAGIIDHLSITMKTLVTVRHAERVASLPGVKRIWLRSALTRGALSRLIRIPHLEELDLFGPRGPGRLAGFEHADSLAVIRAYFMTDADLRAISLAPVLRSQMAHHVPVTPATLSALLRMPNLTELDLEGAPINDTMAEKLARASSLTKLWLASTHLTGRGLRSLSAMRNLSSLDLWETGITVADLKWLGKLPRLRELSIGGGHWQDPHAGRQLGAFLTTLPALSSLWLDGVSLTKHQLAALKARHASVRFNPPDE